MNGQNGASSLATVSRHVRSVAKRRRVAVPEAPARAAHVPVGQLVDAAPRSPARRSSRRRRPGARPPARRSRPCATAPSGRGRRGPPRPRAAATPPASAGRRVSVEDVEVVGRPQLLQEQAHALADRLDREAVAVPRLLRGEEVPAEGVGAVGVEHLPGLDRVALATSTSSGPPRRGSGRGRRRCGTGRRSLQQRRRRPAASRTSRASGPGASQMKSAGKRLLEALAVLERGSGAGRRASRPESNHTSITSGTRRIGCPQGPPSGPSASRGRRPRRRRGGGGRPEARARESAPALRTSRSRAR